MLFACYAKKSSLVRYFFITSLIRSQGGIIKLSKGPQENFPFSLGTILAMTGDDYGNVTWRSFLSNVRVLHTAQL